MGTDPLTDALAALARFQVAEWTVAATLDRIAVLTLEALPGAAVAGMTVLGEDGEPTTAIYTDAESPEIDDAQYREGKGPCLDAWRLRETVRIDRIDEAADRYPAFVAACKEHGVLSTLSFPLVSGDAGIGALNLYAREAGAFDAEDERVGANLSAAAATVLANVAAYWTAFELSQNLSEAMQSRAVIEQAKGMLMARAPSVSADDAFGLLRQASQRENVKLREIAQRIVDRRLPPGGDADAAGSSG